MNHAAIEAVLDDEVSNKVIDNVFYIMNNGISLGVVPEGASPIIEELSSLLSSSSVQGMMWTISVSYTHLVAALMAGCFTSARLSVSAAVSYTHLDVYKRQGKRSARKASAAW